MQELPGGYNSFTFPNISWPSSVTIMLNCGALSWRTTESLRLEKTTKITKSCHQPNTTMPSNHVSQCHIYSFLEHLQGLQVTPPPPWAACASASPLFQKKKFLLIFNLNLPWCNLRPLPLNLLLFLGRRGQPPPRHSLPSESCCREQ